MPERPDTGWSDVVLALLGTWPGRLDEMTATAYIREVEARGARDPRAVLQAIRAMATEHPPSAGVLASMALRAGQPDPPSFEAVIAFVGRTLASRTPYGSDALSGYVAFVADECHEAAARWIADIGLPALRSIPDGRHPLDFGQRAQLRDHERGYREHCEAWRSSPHRGVALAHAQHRDEVAGRDVPRLRVVPEIGPGA
jgi:hypothetical protein